MIEERRCVTTRKAVSVVVRERLSARTSVRVSVAVRGKVSVTVRVSVSVCVCVCVCICLFVGERSLGICFWVIDLYRCWGLIRTDVTGLRHWRMQTWTFKCEWVCSCQCGCD